MDKLVILVLLVVNFGVQSDATVVIPFDEEFYSPSSEVQIRCIITNEPFLGWYKENTKIQEYPKQADIGDKPGVFSQNGTSPGEIYHMLVLPANLPVSIGGTYQCRGKTNKDDVKVAIKFNLANLKLTQTLHFGKKEQIVVDASSYPATKFVWNKDGKPLNYDGNRITLEKDGSLTFSTVKASDGGSYEVNLNWQNRNTANKVITVTIVEKPIFISAPKPAKFIGIAGYDYEFCFNITGLPKPKLQWFKSTVQFDTTNLRYSVKDSCMNIAKLEKNDVAVYKCTAKNSAGETTATVEIERLGAKPTLDAIPQNLYKANVGSKFELNCSGKGDPVPTLEWSKDGKIISSSKNANVLTINAVKSSDSGNYTCTIRNGLIYKGKEMTESKTISFLAIIKPAVNEIRSNSEVYSYVGNPYKVPIRCVFFGVPTPLVTVYKNDTNLTSGTESVRYDVKTKTIEDFGDYVCTGVNIHGNSSHTVKVLRATAPSKPTKVSAIQTCDTITLKWKPPTDNGHMPIVQYVVKYIDGTRNIPEVNRQYLIPYTFKPKTEYSVKIRARNNAGISLPEKITVKTFEYCAPSIPSIYNLGTEMTGPILEVKWNTPDHDGYDPYITYKVFWRMRTDPPKKWSFSEELDNSTRMYTIPEKLKTGKYEFKVTASNRGGESEPSVRVVKVTAVEEPPVPAKRTGGLSKGVIAGIVIAILLIVLITIDLFCCFFNSCGVIFCCQRACCKKTYEVDGKGKDNEMEKLNKNQKPEPV